MIVEISLPMRAFSVNAYHYGDKRHKTQAARDWEEQMAHMLDQFKELSEVALLWQEKGGTFKVWLTCFYPYHVFYNKQKQVSAKTFDISNVEKPIIDQLFGKRMGINDRFITDMISSKRPGVTYSLSIKILHLP